MRTCSVMRNRSDIAPAELVQQLAAQMKAKNLQWNNSTAWTKALKESLRSLLESESSNVTDVLYSDSSDSRHEFLLDIVVWDRNDGEGVILAVESEWLQDVAAVEEDFWKLLIVKAPIKLMIFACNRNPRTFSQDAIWAKLSNCIQSYGDHIKGEFYVFMDYAPPPGRRAWWIEIPENGRLKTVPERNWVEFD